MFLPSRKKNLQRPYTVSISDEAHTGSAQRSNSIYLWEQKLGKSYEYYDSLLC